MRIEGGIMDVVGRIGNVALRMKGIFGGLCG